MNIQLKRLRKEAGYKNRRQFSDALGDGYTERQVTSWETGERMLSLEQACDIADLLDCTLDEKSKGELSGLAATMTADPSRLAAKSGQGAEDVVAEEVA